MVHHWLTVCVAAWLAGLATASRLYVTDIGYEDSGVSTAGKLAVLACQGLMNRNNGTGTKEQTAVYTIKERWDQLWLQTALEQDPSWELVVLPSSDFLADVCARQNFSKLLYSKERHHEIIPQLVTLAGVLDAIPLDIDSAMDQIPSWMDHEVAFDADATFSQVSELVATEFVFDNYGHLTSGVSMMNPGWKQLDDLHPLDHELVRDPNVGLADYIIKERIFNFFLYTGCVPLTEDHALMTRMMTDPRMSWKKPVEVMGYNDAVALFGGDIFEAETNCIAEHNMGQVASSGINNFSFFNRRDSIESSEDLEEYLGALLQTRQDIAEGKLVYNSNTTYMTLVVGDGDNIAFMKGGRRGWMEERVRSCLESETGLCSFPLAFSMSPHLPYLAPDWLHWYYQQANTTGDVIVLPPSGHLYAYPGMMDDLTQTAFMESTNRDCGIMSATASVHWEWFYSWATTFETYFPKYVGTNSCVTSFFATNVPYNFPTNVFWDDHYRQLGGEVFVFKPREWRGTNKDGAPPFSDQNYLSEEEMAAEINSYSAGSVSHLYLTSDGGMNLPTLYKMVGLLGGHVKVVITVQYYNILYHTTA